jgi:uncharacterized protein YdaL
LCLLFQKNGSIVGKYCISKNGNEKGEAEMKKGIYILLFCLLFQSTGIIHAEKAPTKVLLIYSTHTNEVNEQVRMLDTLIGHFTADIIVKSDKEITTDVQKEGYTHLIYFGGEKKQLSGHVRELLDTFAGPVLWVGQNVEQATNSFSFVHVEGEAAVHTFSLKKNNVQERAEDPVLVIHVKQSPPTTVMMEGMGEQGVYPLIIQKDNRMYAATPTLFDPIAKFLGESLFSFFEQEPSSGKTKVYLRLEDVHPASDPKKLKEIATFLKERDIPYMVVVIPVYTNPDTNQTIHLSGVKELRKVLQYMQKNGGSIVLHGYNHQYRQQETGEGFEFWDVQNDSPIYQGKDDVHKKREDFSTEEEYRAYIEEGKKFEKKYIEDKIINGVTELVSYDLYPLAFEAPHYTMSQAGYEILSHYFSTYVGQVQVSDTTWKTMYKPAYISKPAFLHGMKLLPETVGFVDAGNIEEIEKMYERAIGYTKLSDGMIGGFYHPYLGVDTLRQLVDKLETIPDVEWFDLRAEKNEVSVPNIHISTDGETTAIHVDEKSTTMHRWIYLNRMYLPVLILVVVGIGIGITIYRNRRKR